jgi:hypothetical protein
MTKFDLSDFETFTGRFRRKTGTPGFSVQARGAIGVNAAGYEAMGRPEFVLLMYSATKQQIALKAVPAETPHAIPMKPSGKGSGAMASAKSFFDAYGIRHSEYKALQTVTIADGLAVLDAREVTDAAGGR